MSAGCIQTCRNCNKWRGEAGNGLSECVSHEAYRGYAVIERRYIRPEASQKHPCTEWEAIPDKPSIEPYRQPVYDNALIFNKRQLRRRGGKQNDR